MSDSPSIWGRLRSLFRGNKPPPPAATHAAPPPAVEPVRPPPPSPQTPPPPPPLAAPPPLPANPTPRVATVAAPTVDLVLGLDLGTSCSKVVIGDPGWKNKSYAVSFGNGDHKISAWLHPTRFDDEANLKMRLMNEPASDQVRDLLACYLANVIRHSRSWFDSNGPADYRRRGSRWSLNLGFPDKSVKGSRLASAYSEVATVAVALASALDPPSPELASRVRRRMRVIEPFIPPSRVSLYPEIAAQLAGYVNSPHRKRGNLLLIDVGAGTLDVSTIILHEDGDRDVISFHVCEVAPLGVLRLYEARRQALEDVQPGCVKFPVHHFADGSQAVPERLSGLVHCSALDLENAFRHASDRFTEDVLAVAWSCLARFRASQLKVHANPAFDPWGDNLRFFLTGGGCRSPFYKNQLANGPLEDKLAANFTRWHPERSRRRSSRQGFILEPLPLPGNLENFPDSLRSDFDRLSVAYGLALGGGEGGNLMKITSATYP